MRVKHVALISIAHFSSQGCAYDSCSELLSGTESVSAQFAEMYDIWHSELSGNEMANSARQELGIRENELNKKERTNRWNDLFSSVRYRLFKKIDEGQAFLMLVLVAMSATAGFANEFNNLAALIFLSDAGFLAAFDMSQLKAMAYALIRLNGHATNALELFWGLWLLPFGLLVYKSRFIPKILGILLVAACVGYVLSSFMSIVLPQQKAVISPLITVLTIGELPIILWLLIVGARESAEHQPS